jgi:hypothetical protein
MNKLSSALALAVIACCSISCLAQVNITSTGSGTVQIGGTASGGDTVTSPNSTLTVGGSTSATTVDINLTHTNTWSALQMFGAITASGALSGTSAAFSSGITATADGVHSGYLDLVGNTANQSVTANTAGFMGPSLATFTGYAYQLPTSGPATAGVLQVGALSSSVSQITNFTNTYYAQGTGGGGFTFNAGGSENVACGGIIIPAGGLSVGHVSFDVTTGGGTGAGNNSDFGFYNAAGTLVAHIGATTLNTTGTGTYAFTGGTQVIPAGKDYVCWVTAGTTLVLGGSGGSSFLPPSYVSTTGVSGVLPGTITPPADAPTSNNGIIGFAVYP